MALRRGTERRVVAAAAAVCVLAPLPGCSGVEAPGTTRGSGPTTVVPTSAAPAATRPEGAWTVVAWSIQRSDLDLEQQMARALLASIKPSCATGPCDLAVTPAGRKKTYGEPQAPPADGEATNADPITLKWNGTSYTGSARSHVVSCTPTNGSLVRNGYTTRSTWTLTFVAPTGDAPPRVHGTIVNTAKGTTASRAKGCTDFTETEAFGGVPTGSLDMATAPMGEYDASISPTGSTPKSLAPVGRPLWLGTMTVAGDGVAKTIRGLTGSVGPLTPGSRGWAAAPPAAPIQCSGAGGKDAPQGADGAERFADIKPIALTKEGATIFAGTWRLRGTPNAAGRAKGCSLNVYEGRLYLVPHGAGG